MAMQTPLLADRHLCSELVSVACTDGKGQSRALSGNLEEIGAASAVVLTESPIPRGTRVRVMCNVHQLKGLVESCRFVKLLGFVVEVRMDADSRWSPHWFTPQHLLESFCGATTSLCGAASKALSLSEASGY